MVVCFISDLWRCSFTWLSWVNPLSIHSPRINGRVIAVVGYFCDKYRTRQAPLVSGFIAMALATALFISANNVWVLLVARVCQGLSGAVVGVLGLSMIAETSRPEQLGSHMACGSASLTWGMLCGPMTGGFL